MWLISKEFSFEAAHAFSVAFLRGELKAAAERRVFLRRLAAATLVLAFALAYWRWYMPWWRRRQDEAGRAEPDEAARPSTTDKPKAGHQNHEKSKAE